MIEAEVISNKKDKLLENKNDNLEKTILVKKKSITDSLIGYEFKQQEEVKKIKTYKKRGRKPKKKILDEKPKVLKKRGRKPKKKLENEKPKIPQKRGRKPKIKVVQQIIKKNLNESLIIHLPIKSSDLNKNNIEIYIPKPYEQNDNGDFSSYNINKKSNNRDEFTLINDIKKNIKLSEIKKEEVVNNNINKNKLINIQYEFTNFNKNKKWPTKVVSSCLWCCHNFDNIPISLPYKYQNNIFYVSGFFCSYNCAASYSFNKKDTKIWDRYSLLNLMYKKINKCNFIKIPLAPSKEILKKFGGYMNINEYRNNLTYQEKNINIIQQPLISIISKSEEIVNSPNFCNNKQVFIPINDKLVDKAKKSLRLKRKKSIINKKNTLQSYMDLTISKI